MEVEHSGTVFSFDSEGVDVEYDGHEFRMRAEVIARAADKEYLDVTDHEVARMIEKDMELDSPPKRIGDHL
jgi:predicted Zn-dependent protease